MFKIFLQLAITIAIFLVSFFKEKIPEKSVKFYIMAIAVIFAINFCSIYFDYKGQRDSQQELKKEISKISQESNTQRIKINKLLSENSKLRVEVEEQSNKIDNLTQEIKKLVKLLEDISIEKLAKTDSYAKAKNLYNAAMRFMDQGKNKEAAEKFLEFREIAVKEHAYEAAAISSLIAAFRFKDMGEDVTAAKFQSEAGDFYMKLDRYNEALIWKKNAKDIYETQGLTAESEALDKKIKTIDLLLK